MTLTQVLGLCLVALLLVGMAKLLSGWGGDRRKSLGANSDDTSLPPSMGGGV